MSDFAPGELPVRSQLPGQVNYDDIIIKLGDATNPATQQASVDVNGSQSTLIKNAAGTAVTTVTNGSAVALEVQAQSAGPVTPGTAAAFSDLIGGQYNSVLPTLTTGQQSAIQLDSSGRLLTNISNLPGTVDTNYGTVGASTIRTAAQIGNASGAADFGAGATDAQTLRVSANQGAPGTAATGWFVRPTDGTNSQAYTAAGEAKVDMTSSFEDQNFGAVGATTLRTAAQIGNATGAADFNFGAVGAQTIRVAAEPGNATGAADFNNGATGAQTLRVAANLAVGGANVSGTNPVPVSITSALVGTSVNSYSTAAAVAAGSTDNHIYTITSGKTFQGKKIWASASGALKIEVRVSPDGAAYSTLWVGFNSASSPNISIDLNELVFLESGVGSTIEVIRTNQDKKPMDVYSTISGTEV
jgi:hypothetical protein